MVSSLALKLLIKLVSDSFGFKFFILYSRYRDSIQEIIIVFNLPSLAVHEFQNDCFPEYTATANSVDLTTRGKSAECFLECCQSAASVYWALTYAFGSTKEILFFYVRTANAF